MIDDTSIVALDHVAVGKPAKSVEHGDIQAPLAHDYVAGLDPNFKNRRSGVRLTLQLIKCNTFHFGFSNTCLHINTHMYMCCTNNGLFFVR